MAGKTKSRMHNQAFSKTINGDWIFISGLILSGLVLKVLIIHFAALDLHFDEAQYWSWSQHPALSYYSKGPLVAWINGLTTALFTKSEWVVRIPAWICHSALIWLIYIFSYDLWKNRNASRRVSAVFMITPVFFTLGMVQTTDIYMFLCWVTALWGLHNALFRTSTRGWYIAGIAVGIGTLTKLSILMLPFFAGIAWIILAFIYPEIRKRLLSIHPWLAIVMIFVIMSPVIIWNAQHDWLMFRHDAGHIESAGFNLKQTWDFWGGQLLIISPVIFLLLAEQFALIRSKLPEARFLAILSSLILLFFVYKSFGGKVQINWAAPLYFSLFLLWGRRLTKAGKAYRIIVLAGALIAVLLIFFSFFPRVIGIDEAKGPFKKAKGWQESISRVYETNPDADFLILSYYTFAGEFAFYWPHSIDVYVEPTPERRMNQYDIWAENISRHLGRDGLYIGYFDLPAEVSSRFKSCTEKQRIPSLGPDQTRIRELRVFDCRYLLTDKWPEYRDF